MAQVQLTETIGNQIANNAQQIKRSKQSTTQLKDPKFVTLCERVQALPSWGEVEWCSIHTPWYAKDSIQIELSLKEEIKDPQIVRDLIRHSLATKLEKKKSYDGSSLRVSGQMVFAATKRIPKVIITITGYVPSTCRVEIEEVMVPARLEKRTKIVCPTSAGASPAVEGDVTLETIEQG